MTPKKPPCYICGENALIREPLKMFIKQINITFNVYLCYSCLDPIVANAERHEQKLPGAPLLSAPTYPIAQMKKNFFKEKKTPLQNCLDNLEKHREKVRRKVSQ